MGDKSEKDVPEKLDESVQAHRALDQRKFDNDSNEAPDDMRIAADKLFLQATEQTRMALCISDPFQDDMPITYVNQAFVELTGYDREDVLGRNCRFLQGEKTSPEAKAKIRAAIEAREVVVVDILNYHKDGTPFWNALHVGPIFDRDGELSYFYGSQWDITDLLTERDKRLAQQRIVDELRHRTNNLFGVLTAIVRLSARGETDAQVLSKKISSRLDALAAAHRVSLQDDGVANGETDLRTLVEEVIRPYRTNRPKRFEIAGDAAELARDMVTPMGLTLHELATNALKYGSLSHPHGQVAIGWQDDEGGLMLRWTETGGPSLADIDGSASRKGGGNGSRLIDGVLGSVGGSIETDFADDGFRATIRIPVTEPSTN